MLPQRNRVYKQIGRVGVVPTALAVPVNDRLSQRSFACVVRPLGLSGSKATVLIDLSW